MECEETIKDMRTTTDEERAVTRRNNQLMYEMDLMWRKGLCKVTSKLNLF